MYISAKYAKYRPSVDKQMNAHDEENNQSYAWMRTSDASIKITS